jgi:plastocyanin
VEVVDNRFRPPTVTIAAGGTVTWTWGGAAIHDVTVAGVGASPLQTSGTFSLTFATPGTYGYECTIHASVGMRGQVVVL